MNSRYIFIFLVVLLAGCGAEAAQQEVVPDELQLTSTLSPTATQTYTETPTATITPTATPTPFPTATPTPSPTPVPEGYFVSQVGYSLVLPPGYERSDGDQYADFFHDQNDESTLVVGCDPEYRDKSPEEVNDEFLDVFTEVFDLVFLVSSDDFLLQDGTRVFWSSYETLDPDEDAVMHLIFVPHPKKPCLAIAAGFKDVMDPKKPAFTEMVNSFSFTSPRIMGVPRDKALVMLGSDPLAIDLDPALQTSGADDYAGHIFSGLVRLNTDFEVEGDLAESWVISPDGTVYTFTLREGLAFQSGKPLTAEDVRYSWERAADPVLDSQTAEAYLGDIVGFKEKLNGEADHISGVEVVDERTLQVTIDEPKPYFLAKLTYPTSFVVDRENVESGGEDWVFTPNASGPYGLREYTGEEAIVFERNMNYHTPVDIEYVVYRIDHPGSHLSIFEAGEADVVYISPFSAQEIEQPSHALHEQLYTTTSMCTSMIMLNNRIPPMDDPLVREALVRSIDRDLLIENFYNDMELPAYSILPPAMPGHSDELAIAAFDPEAARAALAESGYSKDIPLIVYTEEGYGDENDPYTDAIINMWRENLGIEVEVEYLDPDNFYQQVIGQEKQVVSFGWCADYPDPENFLDLLFHSQGGFNLSGYSNSGVDALLEQARYEQDHAVRLGLYQQAEELLLEDFSVITILNWNYFGLADPRVQGFVLGPMSVPYLHLLSLQPESAE